MPILVTGTAGFIGFHVARRLLAKGETVVGLDVVNDYYDTRLKEARLAILKQEPGFTEARMDLADRVAVMDLLATHKPDRVRIPSPMWIPIWSASSTCWKGASSMGSAILCTRPPVPFTAPMPPCRSMKDR
jgi:NAD(P)-dependent dehydrogenase (short-subunit alcohol dehydrogenase family)